MYSPYSSYFTYHGLHLKRVFSSYFHFLKSHSHFSHFSSRYFKLTLHSRFLQKLFSSSHDCISISHSLIESFGMFVEAVVIVGEGITFGCMYQLLTIDISFWYARFHVSLSYIQMWRVFSWLENIVVGGLQLSRIVALILVLILQLKDVVFSKFSRIVKLKFTLI